MTIARLFLLFIFFSVAGWIMESIYESLLNRRWINRGFLNGPLCPIYGFGCLAVLGLYHWLNPPWYWLFLVSSALTTALEFVTSWLMEKVFHNRWWDYSHYPLNYKGRISLLVSLAWGVLCLGLVYGLEPFAVGLLSLLPTAAVQPLAIILAILVASDLAITIDAAVQLNRLLGQLQQLTLNMRQKSSLLADNWQKRLAALAGGLREWRSLASQVTAIQRRLLDAFPTLQSVSYPEALRRLRRWMHLHQQRLRFPAADLTLLRNVLALRQAGPKSDRPQPAGPAETGAAKAGPADNRPQGAGSRHE